MAINQNELYNNVPDEKIYLNDYALDHDWVGTLEAGRLVVLYCRRVLPGEKWSLGMDAFMRTMPLQNPIFGKMDFYAHAFFVRYGAISDSWNDYIRAGQDGKTEILPDIVSFKVNGSSDNRDYISIDDVDQFYDLDDRLLFENGSLTDDFSIGSVSRVEFPNTFISPFQYSLMQMKAYQSIWSEYYADANLQTFESLDTIDWESWIKPLHVLEVELTDLTDVTAYDYHPRGDRSSEYDASSIYKELFQRRYRCYAKDYFTSCLDEPQRGPDVYIPIDASIEMSNNYNEFSEATFGVNGTLQQRQGFVGFDDRNSLRIGLGDQQDVSQSTVDFSPYNSQGIAIYNAQNLKAEISSLSATITDLRTAIALQEFYESSARYGNRYKEFIYGHFGSMIPDDQLTRPWYLGGIKMPVQISEVLQTAPNSDGEGVGEMYGRGLSAGDGFIFERQFSDYGLIMIVGSIRPHSYYKNSVKREFLITDRLDEFYRKFQAVGEQPVYRYEVQGLISSNPTALERNFETFGYQMRYSEYKTHNDEIHGDFKSSLSSWTLMRDFSDGAVLNSDFITVKPEHVNHIFQYTGNDTDHFLLQCHFNIVRQTCMDIYSIPRIN